MTSFQTTDIRQNTVSLAKYGKKIIIKPFNLESNCLPAFNANLTHAR